MSMFALAQTELDRRPVLLTFAYAKQLSPYRRTWREITRLGRRNLDLILAWNVLFAAAYSAVLIGLAIQLHGRGGWKIIWAWLFFVAPLVRLALNILKLSLFLKDGVSHE